MHSFIHVNLDMVMTFRSGSSVGMYKEPVWFLRKTVEMLVSALCACYSFVCTLCPGQWACDQTWSISLLPSRRTCSSFNQTYIFFSLFFQKPLYNPNLSSRFEDTDLRLTFDLNQGTTLHSHGKRGFDTRQAMAQPVILLSPSTLEVYTAECSKS